MVFNAMAAGDDFAADDRILPGVAADAEKAGLGIGGIEQIEHARGDFRVGAVVDGQGDFAAGDGGGGQSGQVGAEQAAARQQAGGGQDQVVGGERPERPGPVSGGGNDTEAECGVGGG